MVILVCGGREFTDYAKVKEVLDEVAGWSKDGQVKIVNGGYRGADQLSSRWAIERGFPHAEVHADWTAHGNMAGPIRNQFMLDTHHPDQGVAFSGGSGTLDMLTRLFHAGVNTWVVGK